MPYFKNVFLYAAVRRARILGSSAFNRLHYRVDYRRTRNPAIGSTDLHRERPGQ